MTKKAEMDWDDLYQMMITQGGVVVSCDILSSIEADVAKKESRLYVNEYGFGYVWFESIEAACQSAHRSQSEAQ